MDTNLTNHARLLRSSLIAAVAFASARAGALPAPNVIRGIEVSEHGEAVELEIQGTRPPSYTVFKLQDPPRLVLDVAQGDVSAVSSPVPVSKGGVLDVSTAQYQDEKSSVGRIVVALVPDARYEVTPRGQSLVVRVVSDASARASPTSSAPAASTGTGAKPAVAVATPSTERAATTSRAAAPHALASGAASSAGSGPAPAGRAAGSGTAAGRAEAGQAGSRDDHVVSRRVDAVEVKRPATALRGVRQLPDAVMLAANGPVGTVEILELRDPPRLVLDLPGVTRSPRAASPGAAGFARVRFGRFPGKVRVVLDAEGGMPRYQVRRSGHRLLVVADAAAVRAAAAPATAAPGRPPARARIQDVRFTQVGGTARIDIAGRAPHVVSRPDSRTLVLTLEAAELPRHLERSLDASALAGPVSMLSAFNQRSTGQVRIVASLRGEAADRLSETPAGLTWTVSSGTAARHAPEERVIVAEARSQAAGFSAEAPSYALSGVPQKRGYTGRRITLDFHDIEIRNLLRLIADVSKKNIVVADNVTGKVTVSLRNVPWDQALDIVLKAKGLDKEEIGNVIRVAKAEDIAKEQQARAEAAKARAPLVPLKVRLIPVNFASAREVEKQVKDVLSERGSVTVDERTNVLIVKDTQEALARAEGLVRNLDTETPQVLIESRIIEAASNFNQAIGVQWGGNASFSQATGNPLPIVFPHIASATGAAGSAPNAGTAANPNYVVNLPAAIGQGAGGGIGLVFGSASSAFNLNLRLSALENAGVVKTISAPKIATIDNKEATIGQGLSIPFSQVSASGVNTTFVEAKLELKVTPHVTADGSILMKIKATNNQPNPQLTGANGQPSISKREAETSVLVKDGDTTVIGGIYTRTTSNRTSGVPFFGKIPILGWFFRTTADQDDYTELLIFITPRILNKQLATAGSGA